MKRANSKAAPVQSVKKEQSAQAPVEAQVEGTIEGTVQVEAEQPEAETARLDTYNLAQELGALNPDWDRILRNPTGASKADLSEAIKLVQDRIVGFDSLRLFPTDAKVQAVLDSDRLPHSATLGGKRAAILFVDTVQGGEIRFHKPSDKPGRASVPYYPSKGRLILVEGYSEASLARTFGATPRAVLFFTVKD